MTGLSLRISSTRDKYRPKGDLGGGPLAQAARWHGHPLGRTKEAPGQGVATLGAPFRLPESSDLDIFLVFFLEFSEHFYFSPFSAMHGQNRQKLALALN